MAYTLTWQTVVTSVLDAQPYGVSKNSSFNLNTPNAIQGTATPITGSIWTSLSTGSIMACSAITAYNDNTVNSASVITLATGSAGQYVIATLQPGQTAAIPWTGSLNGLYASVTASGANIGTLQYTLFQG